MKEISIDTEIKKHKHILVCGDNTNSLNILRSLGEKGICPTTIVQEEGHIQMLKNSKYIGEAIYVNGFEEAVTKLLEYADKLCPPFVYITDDNHLQIIDANYDSLQGKFYFFNAGSQGRLTQFLDKEQQCVLAEQCGFSVPKFEEVDRGQLPTKLAYPVITKTSNSYSEGWKRDVTICYSPQELSEAYSRMISKQLLLQEYVEKTGEYSMQGISINGGDMIYMPFERMYLRYTKTSFGGYMYYQPFKNEELQRKVQNMLKKIRFSGCFEIEFLVDKEQRLHFLEINLRFSASNYRINIGRINLPYLWAKSTLLQTIDTRDLNPRLERYYVINEVTDIQMAKKVGYFKWLKQFINADGYYLWNREDKKPFFSWWRQKINRKVAKILHIKKAG